MRGVKCLRSPEKGLLVSYTKRVTFQFLESAAFAPRSPFHSFLCLCWGLSEACQVCSALYKKSSRIERKTPCLFDWSLRKRSC